MQQDRDCLGCNSYMDMCVQRVVVVVAIFALLLILRFQLNIYFNYLQYLLTRSDKPKNKFCSFDAVSPLENIQSTLHLVAIAFTILVVVLLATSSSSPSSSAAVFWRNPNNVGNRCMKLLLFFALTTRTESQTRRT